MSQLTRIQAAHLKKMGDTGDSGFDVVVISTNCPMQAVYWRKRLEETRKSILGPSAKLIVTCERWDGGAGNGLGTLHAFEEAERELPDLRKRLAAGASVALYHTAGKGTRLAPLGGSEYNNKSSVKLPGLIQADGRETLISLLEAVIKQTSIFAPVRKGRLSVFWGDQLFLPSTELMAESPYAVDILARRVPTPTEETWTQNGLSGYGLILEDAVGNCAQVEKIVYSQLSDLSFSQLGVSLGAFSLSFQCLEIFLKHFASELSARSGHFDSDPHFWMPLTLDLDQYLSIYPKACPTHHGRIQNLKRELTSPLLGMVDIGAEAFWWDFGQVRHYLANVLKLTSDSQEGEALRDFFQVKRDPETQSCIVGAQIEAGTAIGSVIAGSQIKDMDLRDSIVIESRAARLSGDRSLFYNVVEQNAEELGRGAVRADVIFANDHLRMYTSETRDGASDWTETLPENSLSFQDLYVRNHGIDVSSALEAAKKVRDKFS